MGTRPLLHDTSVFRAPTARRHPSTMTLKDQLRSVGAALRQGSPIVVDVPPAIRHLLLQRHMAMSMQNGRLSLAAFALMLFGFAHEAPLLPRIAACGGCWH